MKIRTTRFVLSCLLLISFFTSCKNNTTYKSTVSIPEKTWQITDTLIFNADITNISNYYNIYFNVEAQEDYLTDNLWLIITSSSPSGNILNDTADFFLTDSKGKWYGKKHGHTINNKFLYKAYILFPEKGIYTFKIRHGMRKNDLPKVSSVGISIEKLK